MKKLKGNVLLLSSLALLMIGCSSDAVSDAESVLKKGVEAVHNNDVAGVKKYFNLSDEEFSYIKQAMDDNDGNLWDKVDIEKSVLRTTYDGEKDGECYVLCKLTLRDGNVFHGEIKLMKAEGTWIISPGFEDDPARFQNDVTEKDDTSKDKHPIFGNLLESYAKLDTRYMKKEDIAYELNKEIEEIIGNEIMLGKKESEGVKISKAKIHSVIPGSSEMSVMVDLEPEDPDEYANYLNAHRGIGGLISAYLYYSFSSDKGVMDIGVISCHSASEIRALLRVRHNRVSMWKDLKCMDMISSQEYEKLDRMRRQR